tara:strand:- start:82418 stop:82597 length:180 start_codon:yes stop_codon:yes gene_type:complete
MKNLFLLSIVLTALFQYLTLDSVVNEEGVLAIVFNALLCLASLTLAIIFKVAYNRGYHL